MRVIANFFKILVQLFIAIYIFCNSETTLEALLNLLFLHYVKIKISIFYIRRIINE